MPSHALNLVKASVFFIKTDAKIFKSIQNWALKKEQDTLITKLTNSLEFNVDQHLKTYADQLIIVLISAW